MTNHTPIDVIEKGRKFPPAFLLMYPFLIGPQHDKTYRFEPRIREVLRERAQYRKKNAETIRAKRAAVWAEILRGRAERDEERRARNLRRDAARARADIERIQAAH